MRFETNDLGPILKLRSCDRLVSLLVSLFVSQGPFKCYVTQMGVEGGVRFSGKKRYEGVMFNVISVTRGWVGVQLPGK